MSPEDSAELAELQEELKAIQHKLQAKQSDIDNKQSDIDKLPFMYKEIEAQTQALSTKAAELDDREREMDAAMQHDSRPKEMIKNVVEVALISGVVVVSDIAQVAINSAMQIHGRSHDEVLAEILARQIDGTGTREAAPVDPMAMYLGVEEIVQHALNFALEKGCSAANLKQILQHMDAMLDEKASGAESSEGAGAGREDDVTAGKET